MTVVSTIIGPPTLRDSLNFKMATEKSLPSTLRFTVYDTGAQITTADFADTPPTIKADHTAPADAIQYCIDNLTANRTSYESIHINVPDASLDAQIVITDDWTELTFCAELITAASALTEYMIFGENLNHVRILGANFDFDYTTGPKGSGGGIQIERSSNIYMSNCFVDNTYAEAFELKTCTNAYLENCKADDFGDDGYSTLDSSYVLHKNCIADNGRDGPAGDTGSFEWEDGSHHCVAEDCESLNSAKDGIHIIVDANKAAVVITGITEPDSGNFPGVYRLTTSGSGNNSVHSYSIGKDVQIYKASGSGEEDGIWPITDVDFTSGAWLEFDMGAANTGLVGTDSDRLNFTHGEPHDIYIYNHLMVSCANTGMVVTSNGTEYDPLDGGEVGLKVLPYNIFVDGLAVRACVESAVSFSYAKDVEIRNLDAIGLPAGKFYGVNIANSHDITFYDCNVRHYGDHGFRNFQSVNVEFYRSKANDNAENTLTTAGRGFHLDADSWSIVTQGRDNSSTQAAGFVLEDCEAHKTTNWGGSGGADYQTGIRVQDAAGTLITNCFITEFSASEVIDYAGGTTAGNTTLTNVVAFEQ